MVSRITELQTSEGEITLGELIRFLLATPEFQTKKMTDVLLTLTEHTHSIKDLDDSGDLVRTPELKAALDEFDSAVADALNGLEKRLDVPYIRAQIKALQDKPDFDPSKLEKRLKVLEAQKPEHKTTVIQNFDKSRIDKIEKKQGEVIATLGKIIDDSTLKIDDLRKEIAAEISKKIQKDGKHVNIIGGTGGVNKLKLLLDVDVSSVTDGQVLTWDATAEKWTATTVSGGGGSGTVTSVAMTVPTGLTISGSPITTSGTLAVGLDTDRVIPTQTTLDGKVTANAAITGATKTKITYDAKGLVTAGADATTADIAASTDKNYVTDAQLTVLGNTSGTNTGDQDLSSYATTAAVAAGYQPLDAQLTSLASLVPGAEGKMITSDGLGGFQISTPTDVRSYINVENGATADQVASEVPVTPSGNLASTDVQAGLVELQGDIDTINSSLGGLTDAVVLKGTWDASAGTFPGSGSAQAGWSYIVSVAGTVDGTSFAINDRLLAITDNASTTTYASNWHKLDYTDQVLSVNSQTGAVVLDADDIDDTSTTNKFTTASDISKLAGIEAGADVTDTANVTAAGALMDSEVTNLAAVKAFDPTDYQAADSDLTALANNSSNGLWARTGSGTGSARTLTGGGGISVTNGDGVSGNPTLGVSALQSIWIPASAMWPSNSGGCGALAQQTVGVNRPDIKYLPFDPTSVESAEFTVAFPKGWNEGTITAQFYWTHPSTTTNFGCIWSLQGVALSDDDAHDTTWGTQQQVTDTGGTTYDVYVTSATSAITIAGTPAAGDICYMHLLRRAADGGDTLAVDAWLLGVKLFFTIDTLDDT